MNLVLVHGILGFRQKFGVEYFRGVAEHFRAQGFAVLVPELDPTRGIAFRGNQLCDQINNGFNSGLLDGAQKTHIPSYGLSFPAVSPLHLCQYRKAQRRTGHGGFSKLGNVRIRSWCALGQHIATKVCASDSDKANAAT
jgi:hypothetical protein